jgi:hypothetical protein
LQVGSAQPGYDARGNVASDGLFNYAYDGENRFLGTSAGPQSLSLAYDALGRLSKSVGSVSGTAHFLYDGAALIGEYDVGGNLTRRTIHGPTKQRLGEDEPIVVYEGGAIRYLHADPRGSIIAQSDASGVAVAINTYGLFISAAIA